MNRDIDQAVQRLAAIGVAPSLLAELETNARSIEQLTVKAAHDEVSCGKRDSSSLEALETLADFADSNTRSAKP